jgi:hypothetical protein
VTERWTARKCEHRRAREERARAPASRLREGPHPRRQGDAPGARGGVHHSAAAPISPRSGDVARGAGADDDGPTSYPRRADAVAQETFAGQDRSTYIEEERGSGWITFAGVMILMVAILNIIDGIAAISRSSFFTNNARYVFSDLRTWGWIVLALGALQLLVGFGIWAGNQLARWTGIVVVSLNAIAQLLFIPAYPFWSLSIFALDVLVLYGLAAYGGRPALD